MRRIVQLVTIVLLATSLAAGTPVAGAREAGRSGRRGLPHLRVDGGRIADDRERTVLLRGVNVNQLGDYFQANPDVPPVVPLERADLERIAALGLDSVRLLVHWSLLEPEPGVRDEAYLRRIRRAVRWAEELGLYVVLDMHQDAWGKHIATAPDETCPPGLSPAIGWDGAPAWATLTDGLSRCRFALREVSPAVGQAWQSFWLDRPAADGVGIQQHLVDTWAWLAGAFRDDPTVAGYDLLNEPNPGYPLHGTEATSLGEYHRRALEAIRGAERGGLTKIVFFEPQATWSATTVGVPRPWTSDTQIVYAPHIYTGSISADRSVTGREVVPLRQGFEQARREASVYGTTFWVGEWGIFGSAESDGDYMERFAALEDEFQVGSAFWQWKQACGDPHGASWPGGDTPSSSGNLVLLDCTDPAAPAGVDTGLVERNARVLSRPYPRAFPGTATFAADPDARRLEMDGAGGVGGGPLDVWVPGTEAPTVDSSGLSRVRVQAVPGGWRVRAAVVEPTWHLTITGG